MNVAWSYFWPVSALGLVLGALAGTIGFRRRNNLAIVLGAALALACTAIWHGPLGAGDRFSAKVERMARSSLDYYEMTKVQGRLLRNPLSRNLKLTGPADDWQRGELVRLMSQLPSVRSATWSSARGIPLLAEALLAAMGGFLLGILLAYGVELRRRYNAQWKW